jgi:CubicO group peptidase (beta-lactamase class C family)
MASGRVTGPDGSAGGRIVLAMSDHTFDHASAVAARQVEIGTVPFVILAVAGAEGVVRLDAFPPVEGPRIGTGGVCLLASITKPIVATAVMRLAQDGRFPLTVPLSRWLPELDAAGFAPFTAWHVLTHTTGLADIDLEQLLSEGGGRPELIRRTVAAGQESVPGSRFRYASFTFDLMAEAVERALDRPFEEVLRDTVLGPLGMTETAFDPTPFGDRRAPVVVGGWDGSHRAVDAGADAGEMVAAYTALRLAGGGLWSTAHDLLRFGRAMLRGGELEGIRLLGRPIVDLMTREVTVNGLGTTGDHLTDDHYAIGWGKPGAASPSSALGFGHGGASGTLLWVDPACDLVLVYLTGQWANPHPASHDVLLAAYGAIE